MGAGGERRRWLISAAAAILSGCVGGGVLLLITLAGAVPDCAARIHEEKWTIFTDGALTAAVFGLLPAVWRRGRASTYGLMVAACAFYGYLIGYWSVDAWENDPYGRIGNVMIGAAAGLVWSIGGMAIAALCEFSRRWRLARRLPVIRRGRIGRAVHQPRHTGWAAWMLAVFLAGSVLARTGLLPVRLTRAGLWLARNHGQGADLRGVMLASARLPGADLREADLRFAHLQAAQLSSANLWSSNLRGADLKGADLRGARGIMADLRGARLEGADLSGAVLIRADLTHADLARTRLTGAVYDHCTRWPSGFEPQRHGAILLGPGVRLRGANLRNAELENEDLRGADLSAANLTGAQLNGADLRGASLRGAIVADEQAEWYEGLNLTGADLRATDLRDTELSNDTVVLTGALYDARTRWPAGFNPPPLLGPVEIKGAKIEIRRKNTGQLLLRVDADTLHTPARIRLFRGAHLAGADLQGFDFYQMDLSRADLRGADLSAADLRDANLSTAILAGAEFSGTLYNQHTRWPAGFDPNEQGLTLAK